MSRRHYVAIGVLLTILATSFLVYLFLNKNQEQDENLIIGTVQSVTDGDTISVRLRNGDIINVRYLGINAPELSDKEQLGPEAKDTNTKLVGNRKVWLEVERTYEGLRCDRDRVLAHVFSDQERTELIQEELLRKGLAIIFFPEKVDDFSGRYVKQLLSAQIDAVRARRGIWHLKDYYSNANVAIAAIKFWGSKEAIYIINRGEDAINLADRWFLTDNAASQRKNEGKEPSGAFDFQIFFKSGYTLPPGGKLTIYTGSEISKAMNGKIKTSSESEIEVYWWRPISTSVWNDEGDTARLYKPDGKQCFEYKYPPFHKS